MKKDNKIIIIGIIAIVAAISLIITMLIISKKTIKNKKIYLIQFMILGMQRV